MPTYKTTIGQYLLNRLKDIGIDTIFGCPGDYNMPFLDLIEDDKQLTWANDANELNASYAADGYARIKGAGAVVTTFGVGEMSAANGTAGSYSEMVPVVHIVGTPNTQSQASGAILHHSLGNGNFNVFLEMFTKITVASTQLDKKNALSAIDDVLITMMRSRRASYIGLPIDLVNYEVELPEAPSPLDTSLPKNPPNTQNDCLKVILEAIKKAKNPIIIADACALRNQLTDVLKQLCEKTRFPTFVSPMGKGAIDDTAEYYRGCYCGSVSLADVYKEVQDSDLILEVGSVQSDFNTGGFTYKVDKSKIIAFHTFATHVYRATYEKVGMSELLPLLIKAIPQYPSRSYPPVPRPLETKGGHEITHNYFWNKVPEFMDPNGIVVAETGTSEFGVFNMDAPRGTSFITQVLWGSIGYSVGAAYGAAMADRSRRVYLFVGDGSFQMTVQEISVMLHQGLTPVIFLLNNDGYLIEKLIHGPQRDYNNFQMWKYANTLDYFGAGLEVNTSKPRHAKVGIQAKVTNRKEFEASMTLVSEQRDRIHFLEVIMPRFDAPRELLLQVETSDNR
ncbi:thiamine diphosphate-binding protein [Phycomyces nitens]|nr:thiamine diphosphate-binding protein [Phycomyces nitens]